ncbi:hypothetical protein [Bifidobacterium favimelis]|uniref:Uncharacterized protein n=1 Tax=Bifidobacterium favimelis TaxID=3122979 RepID=A0ABU8ZQT4_9BIFI
MEQGERYGLNQDQEEALDSLAQTNTYAKQSKWTTFRQLPEGKRWPYFAQHFLPGVAAIVILLAVVISLVVTRLNKPPDPVLSVQAFNMSASAGQLDEIKEGFVKDRKLDDARLVDIGATLTLNDNGYDDSVKALAQVTAGEINMVVARRSLYPTLCKRGYVAKADQGVKADRLKALADKGILTDDQGRPTKDLHRAVGLDLSRSAVWSGRPGLPSDAILGLSNVADSKAYVGQFIDYLDFR